MLRDEQRREGMLREMFPDTVEVTDFPDEEGSWAELKWAAIESAGGLEAIRQETEEARRQGYRDLIKRVNNPTFEDTFEELFEEAFDLLVQRQRKYGATNIAQQGMWGVLVRIADDKVSRLRRAFNGVIENGQIVLDDIPEGDEDDTFEDACLDLANYALILLALKRGVWGRPLAEEVEGED